MSTPEPCASSNERDTQDISREETRWERDTQDTLARSLETRNPTRPGGRVRRLWAALAGLAALKLRRHRSTVYAAPKKNEK